MPVRIKARYRVESVTPKEAATLRGCSPASIIRRALRIWSSVNDCRRPSFTPRPLAAVNPARVRSMAPVQNRDTDSR